MSSTVRNRSAQIKQRLAQLAKEGLNRRLSATIGYHLTKGAPGELVTVHRDFDAGDYERLRRRFAPKLPRAQASTRGDVKRLADEILLSDDTYHGFFQNVRNEGGLEAPALALCLQLWFAHTRRSEARNIAQVFQRYDELRPLADLCLAVAAEYEPLEITLRQLLERNDLDYILAHVPDLYFRCAFRWDVADATRVLGQVLDAERPIGADGAMWIDIALSAYAADRSGLALRAVERAEELVRAGRPGHITSLARGDRTDALGLRCALLRRFVNRPPATIESAPSDIVSVALLDFVHPDRRQASKSLDLPIHSLAALGHLLRNRNAVVRADPELAAVTDELRRNVPPACQHDGPSASVMLRTVDRDAAHASDVPLGTWVLWSGPLAKPLHADAYAPANPAIRPIFVGLDVNIAGLIAPGVADHLREHAPIGCVNWDSVYLLLAAGIPAFFSGSMAATVGPVAGEAPVDATPQTLFVDDHRQGAGARLQLRAMDAPERGLAANLQAAVAAVARIRGASRVVSGSVTAYLAARGMGVPAELADSLRWMPDHATFTTLSAAEFRTVHEGLSKKIETVLDAIVAGKGEQDVYAAWRELCAPDVASARARLARHTQPLSLDFDPRIVSDAIRAAAVIVERSEPRDGGEVNVEFSLDGKYKDQLDTVLESVVSRTTRPVRAFVLCRDHGPDDHRRMAQLFPSVSFVWLPSDQVVYGKIAGKVPWASFATMDRTLLPLILPDVDRMLHLDLDLLVLDDVGELFDTPMGDKPLAAAIEPQDRFRSGFDTVRRAADRLRAEGSPELADELTSRVFDRHPFDFEVFNAGVMVMNLDRMRKDDFCARIMPYVQRFGINGQEVLNVYVGDEFERVDTKWNQNVRLELWDEPRIAHWAGPFKPWAGFWVPGQQVWQEADAAFATRTAAIELTP